MKEIMIKVPDETKLLHLLAVIDEDVCICYETKFCDLRNGETEFELCNKKGIGE